MSSQHKHAGAGQASNVIEKLLKDPQVRDLLWRPHEINRTFDLPYLGGTSKNGKTVYIDRHLPELLSYDLDGRKQEFDPTRFILAHEDFERAVMDGVGWVYSAAHQAATGYERRMVLMAGLSWPLYQNAVEKYVKADEHEALKKVPSNLDMRPYRAPPVNEGLLARMRKAMRK